MPGKVNPVIPEVVMQVAAQVIGNDTAITVAGSQGNFELNVRVPLIARNLLESIQLLTAKCLLFAEKCVEGIQAERGGLPAQLAELTLAVATALNPYIGYDKGDRDRQRGRRPGRHAARGRDRARRRRSTLDEALDLRRIAAGSSDSRLRDTRVMSRPPGQEEGMARSTSRIAQAFASSASSSRRLPRLHCRRRVSRSPGSRALPLPARRPSTTRWAR